MARLFRGKQASGPALGVYIHIPFCPRKCDYCDFYSVPGRDTRMDSYLGALQMHLKESAPQAESYVVDTVYFGGGTPSFFGGGRLGKLLDTLRRHYHVTKECEITVECNPDSVSPELLKALRRAGVNRLSLGMQSAVDDELVRVGRIHSFQQVQRAFFQARDAGFDNLSLDLIYGLPGQSLTSWKKSVDAALSLGPEHLSCYGLKLEEGTPLFDRRADEELPDEDAQADMYLWMVNQLEATGYAQYEISNFARKGRESRHNLKYWNGGEYMGFGPSAHSCFGGCRYGFVRDLDGYIQGVCHGGQILSESTRLDRKELAKEYLMLRMRTTRGVEASEYRSQFYMNFAPLEKRFLEYQEYGWAGRSGDRWHFTPKGFLVSNPLIGDLLAIQEEEMLGTMRPLYERRMEAERKDEG